MRNIIALLSLIFPMTSLACDALLGVYGVIIEEEGFGEHFDIEKHAGKYVVFGDSEGQWALRGNSLLYEPIDNSKWTSLIPAGAIPICAIAKGNTALFGAYKDHPESKIVYFTYSTKRSKKTILTKTRAR
jgi:hypothetical protein